MKESTVDRRFRLYAYYIRTRFSISIRIFDDLNSRKFDGRKSPQFIEDLEYIIYAQDSPSPSEYSTIQIARNLMDERVHS